MQLIHPQTEAPNLADLFQVFKRRKWSLALPFLMIFFTAAAVALLLPPVYRSTSTILIEEQEVPAEFVKATVTSYAEQRIQMIKQRVMSFSRLNELINRFNLYPDLRDTWTTEQIVGKMREDIFLQPVSADVKDRRTKRQSEATIAFTLSYQGKKPEIVQQVAGTLTSLFLSENQEVRERQTKETSQFLEDEMNRVKADLAALDAKVAEFKQEHINRLPELLQANLQNRDRIEREVERMTDQIRTLKEREGYLQTQLAVIPMDSENLDKKRLEQLKIQIVNQKAKFSEKHPDVINTKKEIADLEKQIAVTSVISRIPNDEGTESHNPVFITLSSQLAANRSEMDSLKRQIQDLRKKSEEYGRRIDLTPQVEKAYNVLVNERTNTQAKYNDLMTKYMESQVARGLEKEQKGERFTIVEPARLPEEPFKPNRPAILLIGFVLGTLAGVGMMTLREYSDQSVRDIRRLSAATPFPVLAAIPEIRTRYDIARGRLKKAFVSAAVLVILAGGVTSFHFFVMELSVFWDKLLMKFSHLFA